MNAIKMVTQEFVFKDIFAARGHFDQLLHCARQELSVFSFFDDTRKLVSYLDMLKKGDNLLWAVFDPNNHFIGTVFLKHIISGVSAEKAGMFILPDFRGKGTVFNVSKTVIKFAFENQRIEKLYIYTSVLNEIAHETLVKLHFERKDRVEYVFDFDNKTQKSSFAYVLDSEGYRNYYQAG